VTVPETFSLNHRRPIRIAHLSAVIVCACAVTWTASSSAAQDATPGGGMPMPRLDVLEPVVAGQIVAAVADVTRVAATGKGGSDLGGAYGSLAQVMHAYEFFDSAEAAYRRAQNLAPRDGRWPHLLGYLYQQTGRLDEAAAQFAAVQRLQPERREAAVYLGDVYLQLNRLPEARDQFQAVVDVFPAVARRGLGEVALRERRFGEAAEHFRDALDRMPQATSLHYSLAMAYRGAGRLDDARRHLEQRGSGSIKVGDPLVDGLQRLVRGERGLVMQGRRAYAAGQFQEAAAAFRQAVAAVPTSVTARVNLGLSLLQLDDTPGAAGQLDAALALEPDNVEAHAGLGFVRSRQGRDREAVDHLQHAFERSPDDAAIRSALVRSMIRVGLDGDVIGVLEKVRAIDPDSEETVVSLAIMLAGREQFGAAITLLDDANRRFPERLPTATTLARLLASSPDRTLRDGRRALELAMAVYKDTPSPVHSETVALALAELGRCGEAADWLRRAIAQAAQLKDVGETARLKGTLANYQPPSCVAGR
jgi:tetratricopeptide (TPR) repeat protein